MSAIGPPLSFLLCNFFLMPALSPRPEIFSGNTDVVDTTPQHQLGTIASDVNGNEYIYLTGVASTVVGDWVSYDEAYLTTRVAANGVGPLAVAMAATVASTYGWYQIKGYNASCGAISGGGCAADVALYLTSTPGLVDDVDVAGDAIHGAISRVAESSALIGAQLNYPFVLNVATD